MGILGKIFGTGKGITETVTAVKEGVDKVWYTDEERAEAVERMLKLYEPFKLAQRYFGLIILGTFALLTVLGALVYLGGVVFSPDNAKDFFNALDAYFSNIVNGSLGTLAGYVGLLYFGGGALEGAVKTYRESGTKARN